MAGEPESGGAPPRAPAIHPRATVDPAARLADGVVIGPGAYVGPEVELGARVRVGPNAVLTGRLTVAEDARIFAGAVLGEEPQDLKYRGAPSSVRIGPRTCVREHVTVHRPTTEGAETVVGADVLLMASSHVAHDCRVGDRAILANGALLAGHVQVGPQAFLSGNVLVHQFVRIGRLAMLGGGCGAARDVPPFALLFGDSQIQGLNGVGLRRAGVDRAAQIELRLAYRRLFREARIPRDVLAELVETLVTPEARELLDFLAAPSKRGTCAMAARARRASDGVGD